MVLRPPLRGRGPDAQGEHHPLPQAQIQGTVAAVITTSQRRRPPPPMGTPSYCRTTAACARLQANSWNVSSSSTACTAQPWAR
eukprot:4704245-Prymnesium_polylepis.1